MLGDEFYEALENITIADQNLMFFIGIFESTDDNNIRNQLALKLAETKNPLVVDSLVKLLQNPKTQNYRGNLLSALSEFDYAPYTELLTQLLCKDNYEVRERCGYMLHKISNELSEPQKRQIAGALSCAIEDCEDRIELYQTLIEEIT